MLLTFIIPVRHPENSLDWAGLKQRLTATVASIAAQADPSWEAVVVANAGSDLPALPRQFRVVWVDFPPNPHHDMRSAPRDQVYDHFRLDKGRRVLMGMLSGPSDYFMIVDDDDFVSKRIAKFVADHAGTEGWVINRGYVYGSGGRLVSLHDDFCNFCGTSMILRSDLYALPDSLAAADETYIKDQLGSHVRVRAGLRERGVHLAPLPFRGAVYRVGHAGAHSRSRGLLAGLMRPGRLRRPRQWLRDLVSLRPITPAIRAEFFADGA